MAEVVPDTGGGIISRQQFGDFHLHAEFRTLGAPSNSGIYLETRYEANINETYGRKFADQHGCEFVATYEEVCRHPKVDYVDVCTFPDFRLQPIEICAQTGKHVQVQKPASTNLETARQMIATATVISG